MLALSVVEGWPHRESNPGFEVENLTSSATRRWGLIIIIYHKRRFFQEYDRKSWETRKALRPNVRAALTAARTA